MHEAEAQGSLTPAPKARERGPLATAVALRASAQDLDMLSDAERTLLGEWLGRVIDGL